MVAGILSGLEIVEEINILLLLLRVSLDSHLNNSYRIWES